LGAGFLSGKYAGQSIPEGSRFHVAPAHAGIFFNDRNFAIVRQLGELAERCGIPMVRLAMAWALRNPHLTSLLIGVRSTGHIDNALQAAALDLPEDCYREMDRISR
jgi:aryl-alcohol dehydrogenase-like predicted oxidoreductase